jgi:hypothetical protein
MIACISPGQIMEYILFIHHNRHQNHADSRATAAEWEHFFSVARASGMFTGGSEIDNRLLLGKSNLPPITDTVGGFMRFSTDDKNALLSLLNQHPVLVHGGSLELCEMPRR